MENSLTLSVSSSIGTVSASALAPDQCTCIMTLAHGAGAGMDHPFMVSLAQSLAENKIATLRFNFPFMEHKKGRPDLPAVAHKTIEAAIRTAHELLPALPVFAAGKSFGGRMSSQYLAAHAHAEVKGLIFYGFPLHPPKKQGTERAEHLKQVTAPMLFLQGTRDELAAIDLIEAVCASLPLATLVKIDKADHAFKAGKRDTLSELTTASREWIERLIST